MCLASRKTIPNPPPLFRKGWLAPLSSTRRRGGGLRMPPDASDMACVASSSPAPARAGAGFGDGSVQSWLNTYSAGMTSPPRRRGSCLRRQAAGVKAGSERSRGGRRYKRCCQNELAAPLEVPLDEPTARERSYLLTGSRRFLPISAVPSKTLRASVIYECLLFTAVVKCRNM